MNLRYLLLFFCINNLSLNGHMRRTIAFQTNYPGITCQASFFDRVETAELIGSSFNVSTTFDTILRTKHIFFATSPTFLNIQRFAEDYIPAIITITNDTPYSICFEPGKYIPCFQKNILPFKHVLFLIETIAKESRTFQNAMIGSLIVNIGTFWIVNTFYNYMKHIWREQSKCNHPQKNHLITFFNGFSVVLAIVQFFAYHKLYKVHQHFLAKHAALTKHFIQNPNENKEESMYLRCIRPHSSYEELIFLDKNLIHLNPEIEVSSDFAHVINEKKEINYFFITSPVDAQTQAS